MDAILLSRIQFAFTVGFHFLFPPLTIGLAWVLFFMMTKYKNSDNPFYRNVARFWFKLFAVSFAVGVATGITMEFQFGTNWAEYSRFVGDIFGAPLAAEGLLAFFLESTFMGVMLFGWNRLSKKTLWFASLMVAVGSTLSALWIIIANSWMQTPAGFELRNGRAELTDFWAAAFNPSTLPRYTHTVSASLVTGAIFVLGLSAYYLLKKRHEDFAKESLKIGLITAFAASILILGFGHWHAIQVAFTQPEKLAAFEGVFETQNPAPALVFGVPSREEEKVNYEVAIPGGLSLLIYGKLEGEVKGLKEFPKELWPPLGLTFYPFHLMVAIGFYFIGFSFLGLFLLWRKQLFQNKFFLSLAVASIPLPFLAAQLGWMTAEVGRQPWIVYHVMKTADAISLSVPAENILFSLILFALVYALLFVLWIYLLRREIIRGPEVDKSSAQAVTTNGVK